MSFGTNIGGKIRRLYITKKLQEEAGKWLKEKNLVSGYVFHLHQRKVECIFWSNRKGINAKYL
jgi:hypothetical protein